MAQWEARQGVRAIAETAADHAWLLREAMLVTIWHSRTGAAQAMAEAAHAGAAGEGPARLITAAEAKAEDLLAASGYLFVCPENLGALTGAMKEFFDKCYYPLLGRIEGRAYATAIAAGSDGTGAERQLDRIVTGWRLRRIAAGIIVNLGAQTPKEILRPKTPAPDSLQNCHDLGQAMSAGLTMGTF